VLALLDHLGLERVVLGGISIGAGVAMGTEQRPDTPMVDRRGSGLGAS
jgi:pimeloyl-ACP methyl ester carboxylesterase